jgi:RHS repeat-associated protein
MALVKASDGAVSANYEYGPFGEPIRVSGAMGKANPIRWSTKYTDDESGFAYYGYRYYDPATGRWPNRDPLEEEGGIALYSFVECDPVNRSDARGLQGRRPPGSALWPKPEGIEPWCNWKEPQLVEPLKNEPTVAGYIDPSIAGDEFRFGEASSQYCVACCSKSGSRYRPSMPRCSLQPAIVFGHTLDERTASNKRTIREHENSHARITADYIRDVSLAYKVFGTMCVPKRCEEFRMAFLDHYMRALRARLRHLNAQLDVEDYPAGARKERRAETASTFGATMPGWAQSAGSDLGRLITCIQGECRGGSNGLGLVNFLVSAW